MDSTTNGFVIIDAIKFAQEKLTMSTKEDKTEKNRMNLIMMKTKIN